MLLTGAPHYPEPSQFIPRPSPRWSQTLVLDLFKGIGFGELDRLRHLQHGRAGLRQLQICGVGVVVLTRAVYLKM